MNLDTNTKDKLEAMGALYLVKAVEGQDDELFLSMTFAERLAVAVDEAHASYTADKVSALITRAHLRYPNADIRVLDFDERRNLDRPKIMELSSCGFLKRATNVVVEGFTGSGKSFLACCLAKEACRRRTRSFYIRIPDLEEKVAACGGDVVAETKLITKLARYQCLVLDEWLLDKPDEKMRMKLLELMELRYGESSTIFCTQFRQKDWHARLGGGVHADAILDRVVHNCVHLNAGDLNMRKKYDGKQ